MTVTLALLLAASAVTMGAGDQRVEVRSAPPIFEGWAGRYATLAQQPDGSFTQRTAWQGIATLRSTGWHGLRLFGAAETAAQPGALTPGALETWDGAELTGGLSWDGFAAGPWTISPAVAAGAVVALGEDRDRVETTPTLLAAGARAEYRAGGASIRLYAGVGRHDAVSERLIGIGDVLVRLPLLGDRVALHARVYTGEAASWRYGLVARWW